MSGPESKGSSSELSRAARWGFTLLFVGVGASTAYVADNSTGEGRGEVITECPPLRGEQVRVINMEAVYALGRTAGAYEVKDVSAGFQWPWQSDVATENGELACSVPGLDSMVLLTPSGQEALEISGDTPLPNGLIRTTIAAS
jgi:hypothetical protein